MTVAATAEPPCGVSVTERVVRVAAFIAREKVATGETLRTTLAAPLPGLVRMTCGGPFDSRSGHYRDNIVVTATPV